MYVSQLPVYLISAIYYQVCCIDSVTVKAESCHDFQMLRTRAIKRKLTCNDFAVIL